MSWVNRATGKLISESESRAREASGCWSLALAPAQSHLPPLELSFERSRGNMSRSGASGFQVDEVSEPPLAVFCAGSSVLI